MFIFLMRDGDADAMTPQMPPDVATAIGLVAYHTTRTVLGTASATAFDRTTRHERFKSNGFVALAGCQDERHQVFVARRTQMNFGAEPPLAATQGFGFSSFGRTGRVLMGANDGAIDIVNGPVQLASGIGLLLNGLKETSPDCRLVASDRSGWLRCARSHSVRAHRARAHQYAAATRCR